MRTPRFTCISDGKPLRRLLVISKLDSSESCSWFAIRPPLVAGCGSIIATRAATKADGQGTTPELLYHLAFHAPDWIRSVSTRPPGQITDSFGPSKRAGKKATVEFISRCAENCTTVSSDGPDSHRYCRV